jgi:hypothetical protein
MRFISPLRARRALLVLASSSALASGASAAGLSGVCPDGSMFIVQQEYQIPCRGGKVVDANDMPPIRPEYMPTPYTWQVYNQRKNPNNPYNLLEAVEQVRGMAETGVALTPAGAGLAGGGTAPAPAVSSAPPVGRAPVAPLNLGLADDELRGLYQIVELRQDAVPAQIGRRTADGRGVFKVAFAHSHAFEERIQQAWASRGGLDGPVLLFTANSKQAEDFFANFTFVQRHLTFQPDRESPRQLGVLQGRLGALDAGELVLGYIVLPDTFDLGTDVDIYWNDRHTAARFGQ